jgi:hypothetical protein
MLGPSSSHVPSSLQFMLHCMGPLWHKADIQLLRGNVRFWG